MIVSNLTRDSIIEYCEQLESETGLPVISAGWNIVKGNFDARYWDRDRLIADATALKQNNEQWDAPYAQFKNCVFVRDTDSTSTAFGRAGAERNRALLKGKKILLCRECLGGTEYFYD